MRSADRSWVWFWGGVLLAAPITVAVAVCKCCRKHRIPDRLPPSALVDELTGRIVGGAADGSTLPPVKGPFVWVNEGDETMVHPESLQVKIIGDVLLVSVDLETDQTGRSAVITAFALARNPEGGGLLATTNELPYGDPLLASRWGPVLQEAIWAALLGIARDHSAERGGAPAAIFLHAGQLELAAGHAA